MTVIAIAAVIRFALVVTVLVVVVTFIDGAVRRGRLERFALRQRLTVTEDNGDQVIHYLATTRRWRTAGLLAGWVVSEVTQPLRLGQISTGGELIVIFVGWFVGALVAEIRVAHPDYGSVRAASLQPRKPARYVRRFAWVVVPAAAVVALATGVATAVAGLVGWAEPNWTWAAVWLAVALAVAAAVRTIQHAVLHRPQPLAAPDVIEADDAIRSRSLQMLSGGGAALVLFMVLNQIGSIHPVGIRDSVVISVRVFGALAVALFGWLVATSIWPPPGTATRRNKPALGAA